MYLPVRIYLLPVEGDATKYVCMYVKLHVCMYVMYV